MRTSDFDFTLPAELIAQHPLDKRSNSRLLVVDADKQTWSDRHFYDLGDYLRQGDVLVINNTRVIPARLFGIKEETGAHVELLILNMNDPQRVECLTGNAKVVKVGSKVRFGEGSLVATCLDIGENGIRYFSMEYEGIFLEVLEQLGEMPLPPYIKERLSDPERYQTVYAKYDGSAAAPTAGLHFTPELLDSLKVKGVEIAEVTLHVGLGTFRPVSVDNPMDHDMHSEEFWMSQSCADQLNKARDEKRRIIAVGTTSVRVLETLAHQHDRFSETHGFTKIFITPGFEYLAVCSLITNFHLPKSTLMMLVSAFAGKQLIMDAYQHAITEGYRFFSFGDSMFLTHSTEQ